MTDTIPEQQAAYGCDTHDPYESRPARVPVNQDPDYEKWAAYWQEMRRQSLVGIGEAFDQVAKDFASGDARAAIDVLLFCSDESGSGAKGGIYAAIGDLLMKHWRALQAADEYRNGCSMSDLIKMVNL